MAKIPPGSNPAIEAARAALLAWLDRLIAAAPEPYRGGLQYARDQIASSSTIPVDLVGTILAALGNAFLTGNWGPATGSDADHA